MRMLAVHTFPIWADTTPQQAWELCEQGGRETHPDVIGWANVLVVDIDGDTRALLAID